MFRKFLTGTLVVLLLSSTGTVGYTIGPNDEAVNTTGQEVSVKVKSNLQVSSPEDHFTTSNKSIVLSGKAESGTNVMVEVYEVDELGDEWLRDEIVVEVSILGIFNHEIILETSKTESQLEEDGETTKSPKKYKLLIGVKDDDEWVNSTTRTVVIANKVKAHDYLEKLTDNLSIIDSIKKNIIGDEGANTPQEPTLKSTQASLIQELKKN